MATKIALSVFLVFVELFFLSCLFYLTTKLSVWFIELMHDSQIAMRKIISPTGNFCWCRLWPKTIQRTVASIFEALEYFFIFLSFGLGSELEKGRTRKSLVCWVYYFLKFLDFNPRVWTEFDKMNLIADQLVKLIKFNWVNIKTHSNWKSTKIRHQITIYQINLLGRVNFNQG